MEEVCLVAPSMEYKDAYNEMLVEWEGIEGRIYPGSIRPRGEEYIGVLERLESYKTKETCPEHLSPSHTFFLVNKSNEILGAISIRHYLNEELLKFGGHIGYGVRPKERKKGYAKLMLKMALEKCKDMGIESVLITCNKNNSPSARTIIQNGGIFENELTEDNGTIVERYWIRL